ncbi:serine/threonine-protein kinase [Pleurocapsa sp. PCC 7319]|uniref:serine/threonine-protein kinase n=1 Tax=Pleurocapsa sp. PCC 7319 TaxID=118161 RepID=UPI00034B82F3|nr:serine/threonine-protein kinase [Pleurocapsa sp. PCC 7319]
MLNRILRQRYKIIQKIGSGAFGDTYLAIDLDYVPQRQCVVKHLSPKNPDPQAIAIAKRLFKEEAKSLSSLGKHDQIPQLYSYFEENGQFYLVQEFIGGHNLASELESGKRWNEAQTVNLMQELLQLLTLVHHEDKIHRDIKPTNIMRRDRDGKLVLIDFGAVKEILTVDRQEKTVGIGTGSYMAPEQAQGYPGKYSDVYAVGILAIKALTGLASPELPHNSDRLKQTLAELQIKIDPELESVLSKMISFQPQNRFPDASSALKALVNTGLVESEPAASPTVTQTTIEKVKTQSRKSNSPQKLLLTLLGAIALLGTGVYTSRILNQPNYNQLEAYLQNKQWQKADEETDQILLKIAGDDSALNLKSINKFPCESLRKINQLWTEHSDGRFGFSPQKQVYVETGNTPGDYIEATYQAFGDRVGWRTFGSWSLSGDLMYTDIAPLGHLPSPGKEIADKPNLRWRERQLLLSRVDQCEL